MAVRIKPGQSLLGGSDLRLKQINDALNFAPNQQTIRIKLGVGLTNGVLLDIYCFLHACAHQRAFDEHHKSSG